jgi:hypothetical protein
VRTNGWGAVEQGKPTASYNVETQLTGSADWQTVTVGLDELVATDEKASTPLATWQPVTLLSIGPSGDVVREGRKDPVPGTPWHGHREIRSLPWE